MVAYSNGPVHDPATEQSILIVSEAQPPAYDAITSALHENHPDLQAPTSILLQIIVLVVLGFFLYNFIRVFLIVGRGRLQS